MSNADTQTLVSTTAAARTPALPHFFSCRGDLRLDLLGAQIRWHGMDSAQEGVKIFPGALLALGGISLGITHVKPPDAGSTCRSRFGIPGGGFEPPPPSLAPPSLAQRVIHDRTSCPIIPLIRPAPLAIRCPAPRRCRAPGSRNWCRAPGSRNWRPPPGSRPAPLAIRCPAP